jgi:hypothetical protein
MFTRKMPRSNSHFTQLVGNHSTYDLPDCGGDRGSDLRTLRFHFSRSQVERQSFAGLSCVEEGFDFTK